jgi:hypothetical protein
MSFVLPDDSGDEAEREELENLFAIFVAQGGSWFDAAQFLARVEARNEKLLNYLERHGGQRPWKIESRKTEQFSRSEIDSVYFLMEALEICINVQLHPEMVDRAIPLAELREKIEHENDMPTSIGPDGLK